MEYQVASVTLLSQTKLSHTQTLCDCAAPTATEELSTGSYSRQDSAQHFPNAHSPKPTQNTSALTLENS